MWPDDEDMDYPEEKVRPLRPGMPVAFVLAFVAAAAVGAASYLYYGAPNTARSLVLSLAWVLGCVLFLVGALKGSKMPVFMVFVCFATVPLLLGSAHFLGRDRAYRTHAVVELCTVQDTSQKTAGAYHRRRGYDEEAVVYYDIEWDCRGTAVVSERYFSPPEAEVGQAMEVARDPRGVMQAAPADEVLSPLWPWAGFLASGLLLVAARSSGGRSPEAEQHGVWPDR
ncbi:MULTISPECIES: hypothetical protein [unclassified Nocardiopsis]|uniref:hypothetical protein n=1 Tax=Nocardiopsis TaxID=2013 RepID=UPI00387B442A